jgi:hypothetical protein
MDQDNTMKPHLHRIRSRTRTASTVRDAHSSAQLHRGVARPMIENAGEAVLRHAIIDLTARGTSQ